MAADAHGNPIDFEITGGEVHDSQVAGKIIQKIKKAENFIADKGYDSEKIQELSRKADMIAIILRRSNTKKQIPFLFFFV